MADAGRVPETYRCRHCPAHRVLLRVGDVRGRRAELARAVRALIRAARVDHAVLFGHALDVVVERGTVE